MYSYAILAFALFIKKLYTTAYTQIMHANKTILNKTARWLNVKNNKLLMPLNKSRLFETFKH